MNEVKFTYQGHEAKITHLDGGRFIITIDGTRQSGKGYRTLNPAITRARKLIDANLGVTQEMRDALCRFPRRAS